MDAVAAVSRRTRTSPEDVAKRRCCAIDAADFSPARSSAPSLRAPPRTTSAGWRPSARTPPRTPQASLLRGAHELADLREETAVLEDDRSPAPRPTRAFFPTPNPAAKTRASSKIDQLALRRTRRPRARPASRTRVGVLTARQRHRRAPQDAGAARSAGTPCTPPPRTGGTARTRPIRRRRGRGRRRRRSTHRDRNRLVELWIFPAKPPRWRRVFRARRARDERGPPRARRRDARWTKHSAEATSACAAALAAPPQIPPRRTAPRARPRAGVPRRPCRCGGDERQGLSQDVRGCQFERRDGVVGGADFVFFFRGKPPPFRDSNLRLRVREGGVAERVASTGPEPWSPRAPPDASPRPPRASPDASASVARSSGPSTARSASAASRLSISSSDKLAKSSSSISSSLTAASPPPVQGAFWPPVS